MERLRFVLAVAGMVLIGMGLFLMPGLGKADGLVPGVTCFYTTYPTATCTPVGQGPPYCNCFPDDDPSKCKAFGGVTEDECGGLNQFMSTFKCQGCTGAAACSLNLNINTCGTTPCGLPVIVANGGKCNTSCGCIRPPKPPDKDAHCICS